MAWLLVLLMPLTLFAQVRFDTVQVSQSISQEFKYPAIWLEPDGNFTCTWNIPWMSNQYRLYGRHITPTGELIGDEILLDGGNCPIIPAFKFLPGGYRAELFNHG